jgi:hypothetical protein
MICDKVREWLPEMANDWMRNPIWTERLIFDVGRVSGAPLGFAPKDGREVVGDAK